MPSKQPSATCGHPASGWSSLCEFPKGHQHKRRRPRMNDRTTSDASSGIAPRSGRVGKERSWFRKKSSKVKSHASWAIKLQGIEIIWRSRVLVRVNTKRKLFWIFHGAVNCAAATQTGKLHAGIARLRQCRGLRSARQWGRDKRGCGQRICRLSFRSWQCRPPRAHAPASDLEARRSRDGSRRSRDGAWSPRPGFR